MRKVARDAVRAVQAARRDALGHLRAIIDPLIARDPLLPFDLALLLGHDEAERIAAIVQASPASPSLAALGEEVVRLRARGVILPVQALARRLGTRLVAVLERLPDGVPEALEILAFAATTGVVLDLAGPQVMVARWWKGSAPAVPDDALLALRDRLGLSRDVSRVG
jgi:hypothetical protein